MVPGSSYRRQLFWLQIRRIGASRLPHLETWFLPGPSETWFLPGPPGPPGPASVHAEPKIRGHRDVPSAAKGALRRIAC